MALILVQVVAAAEHLSAQTAAAAGAPPDGPLGFLNICSAQGSALHPIDRVDGTQPDAVTRACALCAMDAMAGHAILADAGNQLPLPPDILCENTRPADAQDTPLPELRYGAVRGPPLFPIV